MKTDLIHFYSCDKLHVVWLKHISFDYLYYSSHYSNSRHNIDLFGVSSVLNQEKFTPLVHDTQVTDFAFGLSPDFKIQPNLSTSAEKG